ncbi:MAG: sigma-70 family RNA polymerase sigma factor [Planctomycetota bacterium]
MGGDITRILDELRRGAPGAGEALLDRVYAELRSLAAAQMRRERVGHTLQPTALVHEAYVRLLGPGTQAFEGRAHFFGAAAKAMRRILVDSARAHGAQKRGGAGGRVTWSEERPAWAPSPDEVLAVHDALEKLEAIDPGMSRVVELRFFSGLTAEEAAAAMGISVRSGYELWEHARAWLFREIAP